MLGTLLCKRGVVESQIWSAESLIKFTNYVLTWLQYIDDGFLVWDASDTLWLQFCIPYNLAFTCTYDQKSLSFLELHFFAELQGLLSTFCFVNLQLTILFCILQVYALGLWYYQSTTASIYS